MEKHHHEKSGNSSFIIGFILGMAAALLLSTKKGRKILKILLDQGLDKLGNWESLIKDTLETEKDYIDEDDDVVPSVNVQSRKEELKEKTTNSVKINENTKPEDEQNTHIREVVGSDQAVDTPEATTVTKMKTATRRFFRGIKKKV